jgi:hypothetical protein
MPDERVTYGVTDDGDVTIQDGDRTWLATNALRFSERRGPPGQQRVLRILQQLWVCDDGEPEWRDVPPEPV